MNQLIIKPETIKYLYYYELPTLLSFQAGTAAEDKTNYWFFVLVNEEAMNYVGKEVATADSLRFLSGEIDLLTLFERSSAPYHYACFDRNGDFCVSSNKALVSDQELPASGLFYSFAGEESRE